MKILVLAGGLSPERNVSLSSGALVCQALRERGHQAALVDLFYGVDKDEEERMGLEGRYAAPIPEELKKVAREAPNLDRLRASRPGPSAIGPGVFELCQRADIVYLALHGTCGEDGRVQAALDLLGVPYTGSGCLASAIAMDKDLTKRLVAGKVVTPQWETAVVTPENLEELTRKTALPAVVKPVASGSSIGVYIAHTRQELSRALSESMGQGELVLEEYIQGRELQVAVLDGKALPSIEIIPREGFYDYANKYQPGAAEEVCPADIPPEWERALREAAETVFRTIGLSVYARADFMVTGDGTPYFLEINTLPGMTPTSLVPQEAAAVGMDYGTLCEMIIQKSLEARKEGL